MGSFVTVIRQGVTGRDPLGSETVGETSRTEGVRARLEQRGSKEGDAYVVNAWQAYLPVGSDVRERDVILWDGRRFEVEGTPAVQRVPGFPSADHLDVALKYVGAAE